MASQVDLFELVAQSDGIVHLDCIDIGRTGASADADEEILSVDLIRGHTTGGSGGSALTAVPDSGDSEFGGSVTGPNTTLASGGSPATLMSLPWNTRVPFHWDPDGGRIPALSSIVVAPSQRFVVRLSSPGSSIDVKGSLGFRASGAAPILPPATSMLLSVESGGRYLQLSDGTPVRLNTVFCWPIATALDATDVDTFLDWCVDRGINGFEMQAILRSGGTWGWSTNNQNSDAPFSTPNDFSTYNSDYFDFVAYILDGALSRGIYVLLYPAYCGYNGDSTEGWYTTMGSNSQANVEAYFGYLGGRFNEDDYPNVIWMNGGDYNMPSGTSRDRYGQGWAALRAAGGTQLAGAEWGSDDDLITDQAGFTYGASPASYDMNIDSFYGLATNPFVTADESWRRASPVLPTFLCESMQAEGGYGIASTRKDIRRYHHTCILSGSIAGTNHGQVELANSADLTQLTDVFFDDQELLNDLYSTLEWWKLKPSGTSSSSPINGAGSYGSIYCGRTLIVSGQGSGSTFIASAMSSDADLLLVYVQPTGTGTTGFSVDFQSMGSGTITCTWWNPTDGSTSSAGTATNADSSKAFTTPGDNGTGQNDWVLLCTV